MSEIPSAWIALLASTIAALIAGAMSLASLITSKEQKVSEFRQQWIDGLREDLASWFGGARAMVRAHQEAQVLGVGATHAIAQSTVSDIRYNQGVKRYRIQLRLHKGEVEHEELQRLMEKASARISKFLQSNYVEGSLLEWSEQANDALKVVDMGAKYSMDVLKVEWERVKAGEKNFQLTKRVAKGVCIGAFLLSAAVAIAVVGGQGENPSHGKTKPSRSTGR